MRDIKLRVWSESRKKWLNECMFDMEVKGAYDFSSDSSMRYNYKTDVIIEQYTGLKDVNGVEIYEGDIVRIAMDIGATIRAKVMYECGSFWLFSHEIHYVFDEDQDNMIQLGSVCLEDDCYEDGCLKVIDVVGNIHQNREILEGDK